MIYAVIFLSWLAFSACVVAHYFWWSRRKERREFAAKWATRPVGHIVSSELTADGLMIKGEIFDDEVWAKLKTDMPGMSIGYSVDAIQPFEQEPYKYGIDHATLFVEPELNIKGAHNVFTDFDVDSVKVTGLSLDKEPNAWGYSIHLADCPAKDSKGPNPEGCICTTTPTVSGPPAEGMMIDGMYVPPIGLYGIRNFGEKVWGRPPTTPDDKEEE